MPVFSKYSLSKLKGLDPRLVSVMMEAIKDSPVDFRITEGLRSLSRQKYLVATGKSQTLKSRHLTGKAVDIVALPSGKYSWDWKHYVVIAAHVKKVAAKLGVSIVWGGDWTTLKDGVHFELNKEVYGY